MTNQAKPQRILFSLLDIPWTITAQSWQFVPPKLVIGILVALVLLHDMPIMMRLLWGVLYGVLLLVVLFLHIVGHSLSGKLVSAPMSEARITPILIQTLYHDDTADTPDHVHLMRALGGPAMNLVVGVVAFLLWRWLDGHLLLAFAIGNLVICGIVLLPLPTVDGAVIWREVWRQLSR